MFSAFVDGLWLSTEQPLLKEIIFINLVHLVEASGTKLVFSSFSSTWFLDIRPSWVEQWSYLIFLLAGVDCWNCGGLVAPPAFLLSGPTNPPAAASFAPFLPRHLSTDWFQKFGALLDGGLSSGSAAADKGGCHNSWSHLEPLGRVRGLERVTGARRWHTGETPEVTTGWQAGDKQVTARWQMKGFAISV